MPEYTLENELWKFIEGYIYAALWSETDPNGVPLDENYTRQDIAPETLARMKSDCEEFFLAHHDLIFAAGQATWVYTKNPARLAGYCFWHGRFGHIEHFDENGWLSPYAQILQAAAKTYGKVALYIDKDGKIRDRRN